MEVKQHRMENEMDKVLTLAGQEVSETGVLSFATRRKLWLAFGAWEARAEDDRTPRALTEPLKARAKLALACAKKVARVWSAYDPEDQRPNQLIRETRAYLDGKRTADQLLTAKAEMDDFISVVEEEPDSTAPSAGLAAMEALITALYDEPLLEECYADATDSDLDSYDWDAAREASEAWAGAVEEAGPGKRKVRRMKFWAWYLEEAAKLSGKEGYRFPAKAIKAFAEKQDPPKPVPKEVTLESLADYLDVGELRYCCRIFGRNARPDDAETFYHIVTRRRDSGGICPKCGTQTSEISHYMSGNAVEGDLPGKLHFMVVEETPFFRCPNHPKEWINAPYEYVNQKAILRRYIAGAGRGEALKEQIEKRAIFRINISEHRITINDRAIDCFSRDMLKENKIPGLEWTSKEDDSFALDVSAFGFPVVFWDLSYAEFVEKYPGRVRQAGENVTEIDLGGVVARCYLDETGALARVETKNRFRVQLRDPAKDQAALALALKAIGIPGEEAQKLAKAQAKNGDSEMECLSGFYRKEAERVLKILRKCGVKCRIMPWLLEGGGDAW